MEIKPISNSPGYYISSSGTIYNSNFKELKTFYKKDGYKRIRLPSLRHKRRVNFSVHLLVIEVFMGRGSYVGEKLQVNHIDGDKNNNSINNLEIVTGTENVNKAHNMGLYRYDLPVIIEDIKNKTTRTYRSIREVSRVLKKSINFIKTRMVITYKYPLYGKYIMHYDVNKYKNMISNLKGKKKLYVYNHMSKEIIKLTAYSQIALLFGIPYTTVGKFLNKNKNKPLYYGGFTFSLTPIDITWKNSNDAIIDRNKVWRKLVTDRVESDLNKTTEVRP